MPVSATSRTSGLSTAIRAPTQDTANHTTVLTQLKEAVEVGQRLRGAPGNSFVTLDELQNAGVVSAVGNTVGPGKSVANTNVTIAVSDSITGAGTTASPLALQGDSASPGNSKFYGTDGSGTKGWYTAVAGTITSITAGTGLTGGTITTSGTIALDLTASLTFTGKPTFSPTTGPVTFNGPANNDAFSVLGSLTSGQSYGFSSLSGTTNEATFYIANRANTIKLIVGYANGGVVFGAPTGGNPGTPGTINAQSVLQNSIPLSTFQRGASWSNGGSALTTSTNAVAITIPYACTLQEVIILTQGGTGSCTIKIWKAAYGSYPPVIGGDITGGTSPAISSGIKYDNTTLTGWTTAFAAGDTILFTLSATSIFTFITILLKMA